MTDGQCDIFISVTNPLYKWVWVSAPTRYGKSDILSMALIYLATAHRLKVPIVAGSEDKAKKIMEYVVQHLGDHPDIADGLLNIQASEVEKLKVQMSKTALRWSSGGWIYITSIDARNVSKEGEGVVGEGGDVVVLEEAGLIRHKSMFSKVVRMIEGDWGKLVMSGNCIEKSVFEDAFNDPLYTKVHIVLEQAIREGRINQERLAAQKTQTTAKDWKRYYLVEFPAHNEFSYFKPQRYVYLPPKLEMIGAVDLALGNLGKEVKKEDTHKSLVGIVLLGRDTKGQVYEVESFGQAVSPDETMRIILNYQYKFERFAVEAVAFQRYFLKQMEKESKLNHQYVPFEGINQSKNKLERIESMEPFVNTGQILFKGDNELWVEMEDYPNADHLDVMDAMEMAWRTMMSTNMEYAIV